MSTLGTRSDGPGGVMVSEKVQIEAEAVLRKPEQT
jgi:hypothetical protein